MKKHCCGMMEYQLNQECEQHSDSFDCPDKYIFYDSKFDEYGIIIRDGGNSYQIIYYCPWCGVKLPESKRDLWFDTLFKIGFDDPLTQNIPDKFKSEDWYMKRYYILSILKDLINSYLVSDINKDELIEQLLKKVSPSEIVEFEDELINESYFSIYHMNEKFCEVSDNELSYLKDCLEGKHQFSRIERDEIISKSSNKKME